MELRKATGSRNIVPPAPPSFHKGALYAMSFACFNCKKSFKRHVDTSPCDYPRALSCPECGENSVNLGRNFKPPKRNDEKQWKKVKYLVDHGFYFQKIRIDINDDPIPYPSTLEEAKVFVKEYERFAVT